jgi:hypothetical protein
MTNTQIIIGLFILLVIIVSMSFGSKCVLESFRSSSPKSRGFGIGDRYAAPVDLPITTNSTNYLFGKQYSVNDNQSDDMPTFFGFPKSLLS